MLLENKNAIVYGGGGGIGGSVARAFAREGAHVFLAGRTREKLDAVARDIEGEGGSAAVAVFDALDEKAVDEHADTVAAEVGGIDVSFNLISLRDIQGTPLAEMSPEDFEQPIMTAMRAQFLTSRAARHMIRRGSGVILFFGGDGDPIRKHYIGGFQIALAAIESLRRQLAAELGPHGIRAVSLRSGGVPETIPEDFAGREAITESLVEPTMLGRTATLEDVGNVAASSSPRTRLAP